MLTRAGARVIDPVSGRVGKNRIAASRLLHATQEQFTIKNIDIYKKKHKTALTKVATQHANPLKANV